MNYYSPKFSTGRGFPAGNPIANAIVIIVGGLVIAASIVLGFVAFVLLASLLLVLSAIVGVRLWWFNRKLRKAGGQRPTDADRESSSELIEGEYRVVVEDDDKRPDRSSPGRN